MKGAVEISGFIRFDLTLGRNSLHVEALVLPTLGPDVMQLDNHVMLAFGAKHVEGTLKSEISVVMTTQKSRNELYEQYGRDIVDKSLTAWNALNKAVERDSSISSTVMRAKSPSDTWTLLKGMVESDDSDIACESAKKEFNNLNIIVGDSARE